MNQPKEFTVTSGYGYNSREPFVEIEFESVKVQVSPENARDFAFALLHAVEAAYSDAFLVEFFTDAIGGEMNEAAVLLQQFRDWRQTKQEW